MTYVCKEKPFLDDVEKHEIKIIRDDGNNRHIRFRKSGTICYGFDLITWFGHLCITGDCGTFVFCRIEDMFTFFRMSENYYKLYPDRKLHINPQYWHEKVLAEDKNGGVERYSQEALTGAIKDYHHNYYEDEEGIESKECWKQIETKILPYIDNEHEAVYNVWTFSYKNFQFQDFFEYSITDYTFHYIWCLYAIVWGIDQYDKLKEK